MGSSTPRGIAGYLDSKLRYRENRANEQLLRRMASALAEKAAAQKNRRQALEAERTRILAGIDEDAGLTAASAALSLAEAQLTRAKARATDAKKHLALYEQARDGYYDKAVTMLSKALESITVTALVEQAKATASSEDDGIVPLYEGARRELARCEKAMAAASQEVQDAESRYARAKEAERRFRSNDYSSSQYRYDGLDLGELLVGYIAGRLDGSSLGRAIDATQVDTTPSFSSGSSGSDFFTSDSIGDAVGSIVSSTTDSF